jgi:hypothetical protein
MNTSATPVPDDRTLSSPRWEKIGNFVVLLAYSGVVLFTVRYHEKWADEAQAWLLARDLDLKKLWFHELRYEGTPGLWHTILWFSQRAFHVSYNLISYIGVVFAIGGVALLVFKGPFPRVHSMAASLHLRVGLSVCSSRPAVYAIAIVVFYCSCLVQRPATPRANDSHTVVTL